MTGDMNMGGFKITGLADGAATTDAATVRQVPLARDCLLVYVSSTQIRLDRCNGMNLFINGKAETIPSDGVTLSNTGVANSTLYYIYAYMSGSTMTLERSTTAYATDSTYGHKIKSGDATRTLVGMVRTTSTGTFAQSATDWAVRSWFNDPGVHATGSLSSDADVAFTSATTLISINALAWAGERFVISNRMRGYAINKANTVFMYLGVNGAIESTGPAASLPSSGWLNPSATFVRSMSEGYVTLNYMASVVDGTDWVRHQATHTSISAYSSPWN